MRNILRFSLSAMLILAGLALGLLPTTRAQTPRTSGRSSILPAARAITVLSPVNMAELSRRAALAPTRQGPAEIKAIHAPQGRPEGRQGVPIGNSAPTKSSPDAPIPSVHGQSPPTTLTFKSDDIQLGAIPPDTMGAVGDNHVVTMTNEEVVIHRRDGVVLSTVTLDDFWATVLLGGMPPSTFDPKILYDRFEDRFIIVTQANAQDETSATLIAVSQTSDPTGSYNRFAIDADAAAVASGGKWADYPSIGFNNNWITVQVNLFGFGSVSGYQGPAIYVLNKTKAYDNTLATVSTFEGSFATCLATPAPDQGGEFGCGFTMAPAITEDDTTLVHYLAEDWDSTAAQLRLSRINGTPDAPVLTVGYQFPQSANSWRSDAAIIGATGGYLLQRQQNVYAVSGNRVTANDSRIQNTVLRNGSLWAVHHVMLPAVSTAAGSPASTAANPDNHTAIAWWEMDPSVENTAVGTAPFQRALIEDPTADNCHNGSGGLRTGASTPPCPTPQGQFFAYANISVNQNNDVLIGYSRFSNLTLPKAAYSFRANTDTFNTTRDSQTYREGVGNYALTGGGPAVHRWGDYSAAMVDPVNDTDFWTIQEYAHFQDDLFFGAGAFHGIWSTWWAQIKPDSTTTTAGNLIISEFRLRGPAGPRDEFVELYNPADSPLTVTTTDGSDGWALAFSANGTTITALAAIPNGTTIPARGHYLIINSVAAAGINPYSLITYPNRQVRASDGDAMYTPDLADNGGLAIFRTANPANMAAGTLMDSVGFAGIAAGLFKEGTGIPNITGTPTGQITFHRSEAATGFPQDTEDNATDFVFSDPVFETLGVTPTLGAAGPQNLDSPIHNNVPNLDSLPLDPIVGNQALPNVVFDPTSDPGNNSTFGTLKLRHTFFNNSGEAITRLRYRIVDLTTAPAPGGTADLRARDSSAEAAVAISGANPACPGSICAVQATTVETPPPQPNGGGLNTSLSEGVITLDAPLADGTGTNVNFLLGIEQTGEYCFAIIAEGLPGVSATFENCGCAGPAAVCGAPPTVLINDVVVTEGNAGTTNASFLVTLSAPNPSATVTVDFATADSSAEASDDYASISGSVSFAPGETSKPVDVAVNGDTLYENTESFFVNLTNPSGATLGDPQGRGFIVNDDTAPAISIDDVTVAEGDGGSSTATFAVTLSAASGRTTTVDFATANGTATNPDDYSASSGTLTFIPGDTSKTIDVSVNGDTVFEADETFFVNLMNPANATTADAQGQGTITNDDAAPTPTPTPTPTPVPPTPTPTATPAPGSASQTVNLSTRMRVDTGDRAGIGGFIITGSVPKHVIVRAIGPSLTQFGFTAAEVLADPILELNGPAGFVARTNNNWRDTQETEIQNDNLPPTNDLESAIDATLAPGNYTAIVRGNGTGIGIALVEVYDLDTAAASKLANLSTRAFVGTGSNVVIAGFILDNGDDVDQVVVRGLGPSLSSAGLAPVLADPTLELRDTNGTLLISDNDWQDDPAQEAEITLAGLAPSDPKEAAIAATLPPGLYTAILAGLNDGTGIGLVEIYDRGGP